MSPQSQPTSAPASQPGSYAARTTVSRSETNNEEVSWTATSNGSFIVGVWGAAQAAPKSNPAVNSYDLEVKVDILTP